MKKSVWICLSLILNANYAFGYCYKIDCTGTIQSGKEQSKAMIDNSYARLKQSLDELKAKYEKQLETLKVQNELLQKYENIIKETTLNEKELLFLMKQFNSLLGNDINVKATENEKE